ncbi:hypothetical protein DsansV1_C07g0070101 [Dioscorea sansibarensis]
MESVGLSQNEEGTAERNWDRSYISLPEPTAFPRIGEEHQARIPPLLTEKERLQERQRPVSVESPEHDENSIESGFFIPVKWVNKKGDQNQLEQDENTEHAQIEPVLFTPLPCSGVSSWSCLERESFLLGLYIFGKDLLQVKNFMNEDSLNNVLFYYYGRFYGSDSYKKWTKGKKIQRKRCGRGKELFTDKCLRKFLGRILPSMSKEAKRILRESAKRLKENIISMECFVFSVRSYVSLEIFVNAVGIGKGRYDLTTYAFEQAKKKKVKPIPREIPSSKAFSCLTSGEIINYLTGGFRLSKTKSRDLFWKAVWPCLVAKGWHSKKLNNPLRRVGSKDHLVFILPGIKKFSKRKHHRGTHYFDSISDVLDKVAAEPSLLEQKAESSKGSVAAKPSLRKPKKAKGAKGSKDTNGENPQVTNKKRGKPKRFKKKQRLSSEPQKFTIVDTSLVQGEEGLLKLTQLRTLPIMEMCNSNGLTPSSAKPDTEPMNENNMCDLSGKGFSRKVKSMVSDILGPALKRRRLASCRHARTYSQPVLVPREKTHTVIAETSPEMPALSPFTDTVSTPEPTTEKPASRHFTDTVTAEKAASRPIFDINMPSIDLNVPIDDLNMPSIDVNVPIIDLNMPIIVDDLSLPLIDLNIPPLIDLTISPVIDLNTPPAQELSDAAEALGAEACKEGLFDLNSSPEECKGLFDLNSSPDKEENQPEEQEQLLMDSQVVDKANVELPSPMPASNVRRQSTRTRPPTLKAIEVAAYGYLNPERSERAMKAQKLSNAASSKPSRRATKKKGSQVLVPDTDAGAGSADADQDSVQFFARISGLFQKIFTLIILCNFA